MRVYLNLSSIILQRVPSKRRVDTMDNLKWIARFTPLSNAQRQEINDLLASKKAYMQSIL